MQQFHNLSRESYLFSYCLNRSRSSYKNYFRFASLHDDILEIALKRAHERITMRRQLKEYTQNLERMVEEKSRKLIEAERMAAVGQTIAGLSHAIKNIASGLKGGSFVLEKGIELDNKTYLLQGWEMLKGNVDKIKNLSLDLLNFGRGEELQMVPADPLAPVHEVLALLQSKAESDHHPARHSES